jgi:hypothetical protein
MSAITACNPIAVAGQRFLDSLDEQSRSIVALCTSADVFSAHVQQLEAVQKAQSGVKKRITDRIAVFSENIEPYVKTVDTLVSSNPEYTALIWGAAKFMFLVCIGSTPASAISLTHLLLFRLQTTTQASSES